MEAAVRSLAQATNRKGAYTGGEYEGRFSEMGGPSPAPRSDRTFPTSGSPRAGAAHHPAPRLAPVALPYSPDGTGYHPAGESRRDRHAVLFVLFHPLDRPGARSVGNSRRIDPVFFLGLHRVERGGGRVAAGDA